MIISKLKRAEIGDRKCNYVSQNTPCPYIPLKNSDKCILHGYNLPHKEIKLYRIGRYEHRVKELAEHNAAKTLRQEIGVARMLLEEVLVKCQDSHDLLQYSTKIISMTKTIGELVVSCTRLEDRLGLVLDKNALINLAEQLSQILSEHLDQDILYIVSGKIEKAIMDAGKVPMSLEDLT
jgi:hypothetical protein